MYKKFDYIVMGSGMGGLAIAALLAKAGKTVCVVEAHSTIGGHAHTFVEGDYRFCHDVQYLMGCHKGGLMHRFLKRLGLNEKIKFRPIDSKYLDYINRKEDVFKIHRGSKEYERGLCSLFPQERENISGYFKIQRRIFHESHYNDYVVPPLHIFTRPVSFFYILKYAKYTLHQMFEKFKFSPRLRSILSGRMLNLALKPSEASFLLYAGMEQAYAQSGHYPIRGMHFLLDEIAKVINKKGQILCNTKVLSINTEGGGVHSVTTTTGDLFSDHFVSDIDPQATFRLIRPGSVGERYTKKFDYTYSDSIVWLYLGLKNTASVMQKFPRANIWHQTSFDEEKNYEQSLLGNYRHASIFITAASLHTQPGVYAPKDGMTLEIASIANYALFRKLFKKDKKAYDALVKKVRNDVIKILEEYYFPDIKKHIDVEIIHTPIDMQRIVNAPYGNTYGYRMTPWQSIFGHFTVQKTFFGNLNFVGASVSYPGVHGSILGAMTLFKKLKTGIEY